MPRRKPTKAGINCGGCGRFLERDGYSGSRPKPDTPPERVSYIDHPPLQGASFMCTCGHYTVVTDDPSRKVIR